MIFKFKDITEYDPRVVYDLRAVKETDDGFVVDCFGKCKEVKRKDIEILKEDDMKVDKLEVKVNTKIDVPTETAEACVRLLEIWVNAENGRNIEAHYTDEQTVRFKLIGE